MPTSFAVRLGDLPRHRMDPAYVRGIWTLRYKYPKKMLGRLVLEEPSYGTSARAIRRTSELQPRYIRITDFDDDGTALTHEFMTAASWESRHLLSAGDILFARSGATAGKAYLHGSSLNPAVFAGYCIRFRFNEEVLPEFVHGFAQTDAYATWVASIRRLGGQPNINREEFKSLEVPVPPQNVQCQLVEELGEARAERDRTLAKADYLIESIDNLVKEELGLPGVELPRKLGYGVKMANPKRNGTLSAEFFHPERMTAIRAILAVRNAPLFELVQFKRRMGRTTKKLRYMGLASIESNTGQLSGVEETTLGKGIEFDSGDVLYGRLRPYLNKVWHANSDGVCSTEFHVMRPIDQRALRSEYLAVVLRTSSVVAQTKHMMTGNTHPRIATNMFKSLLIPLADESVQQVIVKEAMWRQAEAARLREMSENLWRRAVGHFEQQLVWRGEE